MDSLSIFHNTTCMYRSPRLPVPRLLLAFARPFAMRRRSPTPWAPPSAPSPSLLASIRPPMRRLWTGRRPLSAMQAAGEEGLAVVGGETGVVGAVLGGGEATAADGGDAGAAEAAAAVLTAMKEMK